MENFIEYCGQSDDVCIDQIKMMLNRDRVAHIDNSNPHVNSIIRTICTNYGKGDVNIFDSEKTTSLRLISPDAQTPTVENMRSNYDYVEHMNFYHNGRQLRGIDDPIVLASELRFSAEHPTVMAYYVSMLERNVVPVEIDESSSLYRVNDGNHICDVITSKDVPWSYAHILYHVNGEVVQIIDWFEHRFGWSPAPTKHCLDLIDRYGKLHISKESDLAYWASLNDKTVQIEEKDNGYELQRLHQRTV